jgi:2-(1,2-epoxy-1,2-dihydrophenyl)acetyl-CoA isomerase
LRVEVRNRVAPHEALRSEALALAEHIAAGPLLSYRYMKANINLSLDADFRTVLDREAETHLRCGESADHAEGVAAFLEKRAPVFRGR